MQMRKFIFDKPKHTIKKYDKYDKGIINLNFWRNNYRANISV